MSLCPRAKRFRFTPERPCRSRRALDFGPTDPAVAALIPELFPKNLNKVKRTVFTREQKVRLERIFHDDHYPNRTVKKELAQEFKLPLKKIQTWFQNRRSRANMQHRSNILASLLSEAPGSFLALLNEDFVSSLHCPEAAPHIFATAAELQEWPVPPTPTCSTGAMETVTMDPLIPRQLPAGTPDPFAQMNDRLSGAVRNLFGNHLPPCQASQQTLQLNLDGSERFRRKRELMNYFRQN